MGPGCPAESLSYFTIVLVSELEKWALSPKGKRKDMAAI